METGFKDWASSYLTVEHARRWRTHSPDRLEPIAMQPYPPGVYYIWAFLLQVVEVVPANEVRWASFSDMVIADSVLVSTAQVPRGNVRSEHVLLQRPKYGRMSAILKNGDYRRIVSSSGLCICHDATALCDRVQEPRFTTVITIADISTVPARWSTGATYYPH